MSARLIDDMETLKASMAGRASAYSACGEKELGRRAHRAAFALEDAIRAVSDFDALEGELQEQAKEA